MKQPFIELPKREPIWIIPVNMAEKDALIMSLYTDHAKLEAENVELREQNDSLNAQLQMYY